MHKSSSLIGPLAAVLVLACVQGGALAQGSQSTPGQLQKPDLSCKSLPPKRASNSANNILLVMPNAGADQDETRSLISDVHGTVVGAIGEGALTTLIIQTEPGYLEQAEKTLSSDKHISAVQRNYQIEAQATSTAGTPNDPLFPSQWHLGALNVGRAWSASTGAKVVVAVADTGCASNNPDLVGKLYTGSKVINSRNYWPFGGAGNVDVNGHGTMVATAMAATTHNGKLTASPAYGCTVYPIAIATPQGSSSDLEVAKAIFDAGQRGIRVINISFGAGNANYSFANPRAHSVVHAYLKWYHDSKNGLAFFAAGNSAQYDPNPRLPYLMMVSAIDSSYRLARFSNYGKSIWFTAPGQSIYCSTRSGQGASVSGTSFSSPLLAGVAAMVIARNPGISNTKVEQVLIASCRNAAGSKWNVAYGFGMPDAAKAVAAAR